MSAKAEMESLLNEAIKMAIHLIELHGSHVPFCIAFAADGQQVSIVADDMIVSGYDKLDSLVKEGVLTAISNGVYRAVGFARHVTLRESSTEAIQVTLDHIEGGGCTCYLPYALIGSQVHPSELFATDPVETFFQPS